MPTKQPASPKTVRTSIFPRMIVTAPMPPNVKPPAKTEIKPLPRSR